MSASRRCARDLVERRSRSPGTRRPVRGRGRRCGSRRSCGAARRRAGDARRARSSRRRRPAAPCGCRNSRTRSSPCATAAEATDTAFAPISVSVRTRLATENAAWNSRFSTGPVRAGFLRDAVGVLQLARGSAARRAPSSRARTPPRTRARRRCCRRGGTGTGGCSCRAGGSARASRRGPTSPAPVTQYSSVRLQVETITDSWTSGSAVSSRRASGTRAGSKTTRSRTSTGAVR